MVNYVRVELRPREETRLLAGHPWVYANEVKKAGDKLSPGTPVEVFSSKGLFIGRGLASPASKILIRLLTWDPGTDVDEALVASRTKKAVQSRQEMKQRLDTDGLRLLFGEADGLPGLIVDAFGDKVVLSCSSAGLNPLVPVVAETVGSLGYPIVFEHSIGEGRRKEGLPDAQGFRKGTALFPWEFREGRAGFSLDPSSGQKTGFYLDFRLARRKLHELSEGKSILDAFCYQGAASIQAALGGATHVLGLESSEPALEIAREAARRNGVEGKVEFRKADSFKALKGLQAEGASFDGIVLDPSPLARSVHDLAAGRQAFRKLAGRALDILKPGGFLLAASCSHHYSWEKLQEDATEACREAGRRFILAERLFQPEDHPVLLGVPETEYLRVLLLKEVRS